VILLIDAGNTRVKWGVIQNDSWIAEGALEHHEIDQLRGVVARYPGLQQVRGANVAGKEVAAEIEAALCDLAPPAQWLSASISLCGVRNSYANPAQLGADRWAALIGAHTLHPGATLVVTAGTATTIDLLDRDGCFQGGLILPGEALMLRSLASNTAQLPLATGEFSAAPRSTVDAIVSGCRHAQAGAVERMFRQIESEPEAICLLGGGGASTLEPLLTIPFRRVDNLVLKGLAAIAASDTAAC
jgi:type III pantothenate kinase